MSNLEWMTWQIDSAQAGDPPALNLIRAIQDYTEKYGSVPNRCKVHPNMAPTLHAPAGMQITQSKSVKPGFLMLALDPSLNEKLPGHGVA